MSAASQAQAAVAKARSIPAPRPGPSAAIVFAVLLAAACAWILHLPVFPSQDGPAHVFYARVTRDLLLGGHTYGQSFRIAHLFPPYSVHAYILMGMLRFFSGEMAEKLLACLSLIVCGVGLFYFARQLGKSQVVSALAIPFLLNRYLFLGFYGYIMSVGFALAAMGIWLRPDRGKLSRRAAFLLLTALTLFSHPVPYLLLIGFCWLELAAGWWNVRRAAPESGDVVPQASRGDLATLVTGSALTLYIAHYAHSGGLYQYEWLANWDIKLLRIVNVFRTGDVLPLRVPAYTLVLGAVLLVATVVALAQSRRDSKSGAFTRVQMVVGFALLILLALPFLPRTMNGSGFFVERFDIWPPFLFIAAATSIQLSRIQKLVSAIVASFALLVALFFLNSYLGPIARALDPSALPAKSLAGEHLLWITQSRIPSDLTYDPYILSTVRLVDRGGAMLVNGPWLDLQIMMLADNGPHAVFGSEGLNVSGNSSAEIGIISERCGAPDGRGTLEQLIAHSPGKWRVQHSGCFVMVRPVQQAFSY